RPLAKRMSRKATNTVPPFREVLGCCASRFLRARGWAHRGNGVLRGHKSCARESIERLMWFPRAPSYAARMWYEGKMGEPLRPEALLWALRLLLQLSFLLLPVVALFQYVTTELIA